MDRMTNNLSEMVSFIRGALASLFTYGMTYFYPIHDYLLTIMILATVNIIAGSIADTIGWSFKKAFKAFLYLIGYMALLALTLIVGKLMHQEDSNIQDFASWITWVMIYFYTTNILRNWNIKQPDNSVISFLYWVATFKIVEKIKYLKEYKLFQRNKDGNS